MGILKVNILSKLNRTVCLTCSLHSQVFNALSSSPVWEHHQFVTIKDSKLRCTVKQYIIQQLCIDFGVRE